MCALGAYLSLTFFVVSSFQLFEAPSAAAERDTYRSGAGVQRIQPHTIAHMDFMGINPYNRT